MEYLWLMEKIGDLKGNKVQLQLINLFFRKTFSHLFKTSLMKTVMYETFIKHGKEVIDQLSIISETNKPINIQQLFYKYTLDSIGEIAFGKNIGSMQEESKVSKAFDNALNCVERRVSWPFWKFTPDFLLSKSISILNNYSFNLIKERREDSNIINKSDLLSSYIMNTKEDDIYLKDVIMNFLIAGRDTTGQTLTWLFYLLSINLNVQKILLEEIDSKLNVNIPTFDQLKTMPFLENVINETLRLYPPVPVDPKCALNDDVLPNGTFIPKGTIVFWSAWIMGRYFFLSFFI
jgi:cytochrome P450